MYSRAALQGAAFALLCCLCSLSGCRRAAEQKNEVVYVAAPQVNLRDRVAAVFNKTGSVTNGERLEVLEHTHNGRFVRVRDPRNEEGWIEQRYLASSDVFDQFQQLGRQNSALPAQAVAITRNETNMHLTPARDSDHLYQLKEGEKLELLKRAVAPRSGQAVAPPAKPPSPAPPAAKPAAAKASASKPPKTAAAPPPEEPAPILEDWWLARDSHKRYGWVLSRLVDIDIPVDVAQYAEGQHIVGDFILNTVPDGGRQVPQYLLLLNEPKDGEPQDFNQLRVFTWNLKRHRYETAYREHDLFGVLPAHVGVEDFGKDGRQPVATIQEKDRTGNLVQIKYRLNGVMFRRILAPGEAPTRAARRKPAR